MKLNLQLHPMKFLTQVFLLHHRHPGTGPGLKQFQCRSQAYDAGAHDRAGWHAQQAMTDYDDLGMAIAAGTAAAALAAARSLVCALPP